MAGDRRTVLMTADTVGGVWTYAVDLSRALDAHGFDVHLATLGGPVKPHQREDLRGAANVTVHEGGFALEWMDAPWRQVDEAGEWLLALARRIRPSVVHVNQFAFGALPFDAPKLLVAHSCVLSWWRAVHGEAAPPSWSTYRARVQAGLRGADLVAAPTAAMLRTLHENYAFDTRAIVLPNGRDARRFAPARKQPFVFAAGRLWDEAKNLAALEAAAPGLDWPVRVAGACVRPDGREHRPAGVRALGELPPADIARHMAHAAIYALPARYEPFGLSVLEAALSGCALVLGDIASLRETWGDDARYVPPGDSAALHQALRHLIADAGTRERLGAAARRRALRFPAAVMADACAGAYRSLVPQSATSEEPQCA